MYVFLILLNVIIIITTLYKTVQADERASSEKRERILAASMQREQ